MRRTHPFVFGGSIGGVVLGVIIMMIANRLTRG
jgi:hypothetical protein